MKRSIIALILCCAISTMQAATDPVVFQARAWFEKTTNSIQSTTDYRDRAGTLPSAAHYIAANTGQTS